MKQRWWHKKRYRWAVLGSVLSVLGPLGEFLFLKLLEQPDIPALWLTYVYTEILTLVSFTTFGYIIGRYTEQVEYDALHDALTGTYNRGYLMSQFKEMLAVHDRYAQPCSALMLDLDYFKQVNDRYGHPVGDKTLIAFARCIKQTIRAPDMVGRYGGEEFVVLCPNTGGEEVKHLAERIRSNVATLTAGELGHPGPQTVSAGVIVLAADERMPLQSVLERLDQALYQAKQQGRNRVECATP